MGIKRDVIEISEEDFKRVIGYFKIFVDMLAEHYDLHRSIKKKGVEIPGEDEKIQMLEIDKAWLKKIGKKLKEIEGSMKIGNDNLKIIYSLMRRPVNVPESEIKYPDELPEDLKDNEEYFVLTKKGNPNVKILKERFSGIKILIPDDLWSLLKKEVKKCQRNRLEGFYELIGFRIRDSIVITGFHKPEYTTRSSTYMEYHSKIPLRSLFNTHEKVVVHVHPIEGPSQIDINHMKKDKGYFLIIKYTDKLEDITEGDMYEMPVKSRKDLKKVGYKIALF